MAGNQLESLGGFVQKGDIVKLSATEQALVRLAFETFQANMAQIQAADKHAKKVFADLMQPIREAHDIPDGVAVSAKDAEDGSIIFVIDSNPVTETKPTARPARRRTKKANK